MSTAGEAGAGAGGEPAPVPGAVHGPVRALVAGDNPVVRAGLAVLLGRRRDVRVVAECPGGTAALTAARLHRPDAVILDLGAPAPWLVGELEGVAPVQVLGYGSGAEPGALVHGEFTIDQLAACLRALSAGAVGPGSVGAGSVGAGSAGVRAAVLEGVLDGVGRPGAHPAKPGGISYRPSPPGADVAQSASIRRRWATGVPEPRPRYGLSGREVEVMGLIASGMANSQIAAACHISEKTVKNHINRIFTKLDARSRSEAIALWLGTAAARGGRDA